MERHCKIIFKINDSKKAKKYNLNQVFWLRIKVGKSGRIIKIKQIKATPKIIADRVATGNKGAENFMPNKERAREGITTTAISQ